MFTSFKTSIAAISLPERFTFPFYYEPHPLAVIAANELQEHLKTQTDWTHNFGIEEGKEGMIIGKMFGVLVVQNQVGELGYLSAFSGKLAESNHHPRFVPPVFDMLTEGSFFQTGIVVINEINDKIATLESSKKLRTLKALLKKEKEQATTEIAERKALLKTKKKERKAKRKEGQANLSASDYKELEAQLIWESQIGKIRLKHLTDDWKKQLEEREKELNGYLEEIEQLKALRKEKSAALQAKLFKQYKFLNQSGESKHLLDIFKETTPMAGSGECAAPKLLQYAFLNQLKPITMAEFWWGQPPKSEVREHGQFYPACRGKCRPILGHMLKGIKMDENPMLQNTALGKRITTVYEDEAIVIINKPHEFLSVPGKHVEDSVQFRMELKYADATGPLIVHRLDMSTSGLMVIAKTKEAHQYLQYQFIKRRVKKRYAAVLDGIVEQEEGVINLPLRVDLEDRPRQLVCYEHGKTGVTRYRVIRRVNGKTHIYFYPETGRTHQLRVHAAHQLGLNCPIVGDDLYGKKGKRLHLHAEYLAFKHPVSRELVEFEVKADF